MAFPQHNSVKKRKKLTLIILSSLLSLLWLTWSFYTCYSPEKKQTSRQENWKPMMILKTRPFLLFDTVFPNSLDSYFFLQVSFSIFNFNVMINFEQSTHQTLLLSIMSYLSEYYHSRRSLKSLFHPLSIVISTAFFYSFWIKSLLHNFQ